MDKFNTDSVKRKIIQKDGKVLNIFEAVDRKERSKVNDEHVIPLFHEIDMNKVTWIRLSGFNNITDKLVIAIAEKFPNLVFLNVNMCSKVTGVGIEAIARNCRKLERLSADSCSIEYIPEDIGLLLPELKGLYLNRNKIKKIPSSIGMLVGKLTVFDVENNPIEEPSLEAARDGPAAIRSYYESRGVVYSNLISNLQDMSLSNHELLALPSSSSSSAFQCDIFISARFLGDSTEREARELHSELVKLGLKAFIIDANAGEDFGKKCIESLYRMKTLVAFCSSNYGAKTISSYSSYYELKYANEKQKHIIPIRRCEEWPPAPLDFDGQDEGKMQNDFVFNTGMAYLDWYHVEEWDAAECANQIKIAFEKKHSGS